jgi:low affinity Fe/Cu permease
MSKPASPISLWFERLAHHLTMWTGSTWAFVLAAVTIILWGITGPLYGFSDTWQLVINTSTTIVTFLMVFLIQRAQNKDSLAIQLKLNEIVAALKGASNRLINVEDLSEQEVRALHRHYEKLAELAQQDRSRTASHSIEDAVKRHRCKHSLEGPADCPGGTSGPEKPSAADPTNSRA